MPSMDMIVHSSFFLLYFAITYHTSIFIDSASDLKSSKIFLVESFIGISGTTISKAFLLYLFLYNTVSPQINSSLFSFNFKHFLSKIRHIFSIDFTIFINLIFRKIAICISFYIRLYKIRIILFKIITAVLKVIPFTVRN